MVTAIASCSAAIARLDARISASSVGSAWSLRAAWTGFAEALQLQGVEIDEIDVFSWGCGLNIPGRAIRATHLDEFAEFDGWRQALLSSDPLEWRDALPPSVFDQPEAAEHPPLIRAIDRVRQYSRQLGTIAPWLGLPFSLRDQGLSHVPLPCLCGGAKAMRLKPRLSDTDWLPIVRALQRAAADGTERLDQLERLYRDAQRAIVSEYRPGALPSLAALTIHRPLLSPQFVSEALGLTIAGASKLLERGVGSGLLVEVTRRRSWRVFVAGDLAVTFGYASPQRGRPRLEPPPPPVDRSLRQVFDSFDEQMAEIDRLLARS
ncbi:hypothetical protein CV103_07285 [Sphingomonas fennica]|uniref:Uncharacterized protein n=2 Tax=Edaphosphingomonas fennica TaxID=114404 RepID=A0A2T4I4Q3_9SPHN|nr:hypothetical protein CV103_07285 [Sphingomonas fennica]